MSAFERMSSGFGRIAPPDERAQLGVSVPRRTSAGLALTVLGAAVVVLLSLIYAALGSAVSGLATSSVAVALVAVTLFVPQTVSLAVVGNGISLVSWGMTFVVAYRTGGPTSPGLVWCFLHPITTYLSSGRRSAAIWTGMSALQLAIVLAYDDLGIDVHDDLSPNSARILRDVMLLAAVLGVVVVIAGVESARQASDAAVEEARQALERQRILGDMHDGIGSQLLGLMIQVRAKRIDDERLLQGLESCLDDLKLIVDSLDPVERPFGVAVGELRARLEPRCTAQGVDLTWEVDEPPAPIGAERTLQVLRFLQEATSNALRHAHTDRIEVRLGPATLPETYEVSVRDHGTGFDPAHPQRTGRGLTSLRTRAQRLGGTFDISAAAPGTNVRLRFALE